jgi:transcriptional regulator with XRE-family HTH domain
VTHQANLPLSARTLGEAIRTLREARKLTLRALALKVGVSAPFLSDLEHDRRKTDQLDGFADALGVPVEELRKLDVRITPEFKDWLLEQPALVAFLKDIQKSGETVPVEAMRATIKKSS